MSKPTRAIRLAEWIETAVSGSRWDDRIVQSATELRALQAIADQLLEALQRIKATGAPIGAIAQEMMDAAILRAQQHASEPKEAP